MLKCSICSSLTSSIEVIPTSENGELTSLFILPCKSCGDKIREEFRQGSVMTIKKSNKLYTSVELEAASCVN